MIEKETLGLLDNIASLDDVRRLAWITAAKAILSGAEMPQAIEQGNVILIANGYKPISYGGSSSFSGT